MDMISTLKPLAPLAPVIIVSLTAVLVMLLVAIKRQHDLIATATVIGLNAAVACIVWQVFFQNSGPQAVMGLFVVDGFALFNMALILIASLACCTLAHAYIDSYQHNREELYLLLLIAVAGGMLMTASSHMTSFFMSLELLSIPTYGLLAYTHERSKSLESGIKYLVLSATASAALLMGMAFLYSYTGTMDFRNLGQILGQVLHEPIVVMGFGLIVIAIAFKLSLAPFHGWTPDVYQGAPAPAATFLATVSKVAMLAVAVRFLLVSSSLAMEGLHTVLATIAVLSILVGNLLAVRQVNLKRLLGYSSIAHFGYVLIAIICLGVSSIATVSIYLVTYVLTTIGAFGAVALMSSPYSTTEAESIADYRGLFWRRPVLTAVLTVMMLSLAGIPLTAGFIGKFFVIMAAVQNMSWFLAAMIILGSAIGLYYYLRVMVVLYMTPPDTPRIDAQTNWGVKAGGIMVLLTSLLVLLLGVYPQPLIKLAALAQIVVMR
ncbi:NADH-quinone oxidoreductase subunit NuoN [Alkanindiges illinoisensis]|uniref:NADH-quinone oxidoreductase subunit N n=1 Tax=Alkanindiges illinoisensis TaxID=197183 RepID=A0A4Y7X956_9GAMM|nr:NADH-quinone oxidoreductase subunit NuoN [Alkanindiges illinoisensis]TEU23881.1 NADH-quinone oxidoreductase subunit NuoN [Alkanindiges illinoisensis]